MNLGIICADGTEKNGAVQWINHQIRTELERLELQEAYSCLMNEAECLMGRMLLQQKLQLVKVEPNGCCPLLHPEALPGYGPEDESQGPHDVQVYYEAGERLVNQVDVLIAVWNTLRQKGVRDIANLIAYAKTTNKTIIQLNPANKSKKVLKKW